MFRPMLAPLNSPADTPTFFKDIIFPVLASPKLDGIRAVVKTVDVFKYDSTLESVKYGSKISVLSRKLKQLPNMFVQQRFGIEALLEMDGELVVGEPNDPMVYNKTQSYVMSVEKDADFKFFVFDYACEDSAGEPYFRRLDVISDFINKLPKSMNVHLLEQKHCENIDDLLEYENEQLSNGFEGIMFRNPIGHYKHNRATYRENLIYKLKRFSDNEAKIIDFKERLHNTNEVEIDETGYTSRSSKSDGLIPTGMVGGFICDFNGMEIVAAPGVLTHSQLISIWENRDRYIGKYVKFRSFGHGVKDKPRFPRVIGFRDIIID